MVEFFLKNNLTILYPIKLKGEGGSGQITFLNYYGETRDKKSEMFNNNSNFIIDINRDTYENKMKYINNLTRTVTIYNSGNLPLIIKSITVDGNECQTDDLKVVQCREFLIDVGETMEIDFEVNTNFNSKITNRIVRFQSEFQVFELNVIIILSQDLYNQNPSVCLQLERLSRTNRQNLMSASGLDNEMYNKLMQKLTQGLFIQYEGYDIIPTQRFRQGMSMINRNGNIHKVGEQDA